jgi:hypothetical protein
MEYKGEPLATLRGVVEANDALESRDDLVAAIVWMTAEPPPNFKTKLVGSRVAIRGSFPASFQLDLYTPPPPEAQHVVLNGYRDRDGKVWPAGAPLGTYTGMLAAIDANANMDELKSSDILGIDREHMVVFLSEDLPAPVTPMPGSEHELVAYEEILLREKQATVIGFHVPLQRGYHLAKTNPAYKDWFQQIQDCVWDGLCVDWRIANADGYIEHDMDLCTERFPDNPTCSAWEKPYAFPGETEPASSVECRQRFGNRDHCYTATTQADLFSENPNGFADPISLDIGSKLYQFGL